jgi:23S rRNA (cytosine1962-C5)-methyltransferase
LLCEIYSLGIAQRLSKWLPLLHELAGTKFARVHVDHDLGSLEGIKPSLQRHQRCRSDQGEDS